MKETDKAKKILGNVEHWKAFWVNSGPIYKNLGEFSNKVGKLNAKQFEHHVQKEKNDFAKWIGEAVGDKVLAKKIRTLKTKRAIAQAAKQRVVALEKIAKK
jgi:hypothetical protein